MQANPHPVPAQETRLGSWILVAALMQTVVTLCGLWVLGLLLAPGRSETLHDLISLCSAVSTALLKVGLHLLGP